MVDAGKLRHLVAETAGKPQDTYGRIGLRDVFQYLKRIIAASVDDKDDVARIAWKLRKLGLERVVEITDSLFLVIDGRNDGEGLFAHGLILLQFRKEFVQRGNKVFPLLAPDKRMISEEKSVLV